MTDKAKIMVVDDEELIRFALALFLENAGYEVFGTGAWPDESVIAQGFSVIILDIIMPGRNGLDAINELRRRGDATKIIGISGSPDALKAASLCGADKVLKKPFALTELLSILSSLLGTVA